MATLIPSRTTCLPRMTAGERRFAHRLEDKLEDDYLVWYDIPIGPKHRQPDYVILHPRRGLLVLEVKDWKPETLHRIDRSRAVLRGDFGEKTVTNPLLQARAYALELKMALEADPLLHHPGGHAHAGKLVSPWGYGVVLTQITRAMFEAAELGHVLDEHRVICQDEMTETVDPEAFQQRLWAMFDYQFRDALTRPQIERIRWHLFPEIRVLPPLQADLLSVHPHLTAAHPLHIPDVIRVMDLHQEQLARSLGDGHRVVHGVAGSGKTMLLGYRCLHLAQQTGKPVLVLCFNRTLAARLRQVIGAQRPQAPIEISNFHAWCAQMLRTYHVAAPAGEPGGSEFFAAQVQAVIAGVDAGTIPRAQYGAVLIDEGHDFEADWLRLIVQMVDPATNTLLLLYDDAQAIYAKPEKRRFSFASVGIEARGRTTILKLNYRNTYEVLAVAKAFADELFADRPGDEDAPAAIPPESVGRHGSPPQLIRCTSLDQESRTIASLIDDARAEGCDLNQIAVLWRHRAQSNPVIRELARHGIPFTSAKDSHSKAHLFEGKASVKLVSMHSAKGLEFERVFIPAIDRLPGTGDDPVAEAKLLYVAMTRATDKLVMTCTGDGGFVGRLDRSLRACVADSSMT